MGKKILRRFAMGCAAGAMLAAAGCGSGSGSGGSSSVSGVVADGYIQGATVFLDKNGNKVLDADEPTATTGTGGAYTLEGVSAADVAAYPVVVQVPVGATDEDRGRVTTEYILTAPAGKPEFVSPLTTLVQQQVEDTGVTAEQAEAAVKATIGLSETTSLFTDFKANAGNADYAFAANVAKVVATAIAENKEAIETAAGAGNVDVNAVTRLVVAEVVRNVAQIAEAVKSAPDMSDEDAIRTMATTAVAVSTTNIQEQLDAAAEIPTISTGSQLLSVMTGDGLYWLERYYSQAGFVYQYGHNSFGALANGAYPLTFSDYQYLNGAWQSSQEEGAYFLTASGWQLLTEDGGTVVMNADGSAMVTETGGFKMNVRMTEVDLADKAVSPFAAASGFIMSPGETATFPSGSKAYKFTMTPLSSRCKVYPNWYFTKYDTLTQQQSYVTTLTDLIQTFSTSQKSYTVGFSDKLGLRFGAGTDSGTVDFYQMNPGDWTTGASVGTGAWKLVTVNGVQMIRVTTLSVRTMMGDEGRDLIFAVVDGMVFGGSVEDANVPRMDKGYNFNKTAFNSLLATLRLPEIN